MMTMTVTIKDIPSSLFELLRKKAAGNRRSINNEILSTLEKSYPDRKINPDAFLTSARKLREKTIGHLLTDDLINRVKHEGRP